MNGDGRAGHLVFLWSPVGYTLQERPGDPPAPGSELEEGERRFVVTKVAPSPLPDDPRPCAYLLPV
ncbi:MAG: hypothetical protein KatS3mg012_0785 [Gaiellaceae bacterium]|jgi:hypothetical protein|nr:MAG: hypothetical protein KatS3mg012_0785 [Gaiellaceae bacterium]